MTAPMKLLRAIGAGRRQVLGSVLVEAVVVGLVAVGFATMLVGMVVVMPLLGHASWHAYRDLVDAESAPLRHPGARMPRCAPG